MKLLRLTSRMKNKNFFYFVYYSYKKCKTTMFYLRYCINIRSPLLASLLQFYLCKILSHSGSRLGRAVRNLTKSPAKNHLFHYGRVVIAAKTNSDDAAIVEPSIWFRFRVYPCYWFISIQFSQFIRQKRRRCRCR